MVHIRTYYSIKRNVSEENKQKFVFIRISLIYIQIAGSQKLTYSNGNAGTPLSRRKSTVLNFVLTFEKELFITTCWLSCGRETLHYHRIFMSGEDAIVYGSRGRAL